MLIRVEALPSDAAALSKMVVDLAAEVDKLRGIVDAYKSMLFGQRSERMATVSTAQLALELGDLAPSAPLAGANENEPANPRRPPRRGREAKRNIGALPLHLPRYEEVIEPASTACRCCSRAMHRIGEDIREALSIVPASLFVKRRVFPKYACRSCEEGVVQAAAPERAVAGGMATDELVVHVAVSKFGGHSPLYRQAQMMAWQGVDLDRSTLARWMSSLAWWLRPVYERQLRVTHRQARIFCDETPLPVLDPGLGRVKRGQMWAHAMDDRPWSGPAPPAVTYVYGTSRSSAEIAKQLAAFDGVLQVDGYEAYKTHARKAKRNIELAFCFAHARRKFVAVHKSTGSPFAKEVIETLAQVYALEARIRGSTPEERRAARQAHSKPILDVLEMKLVAALADVSRQTSLANAMSYTLDHWAGLTRFLGDGRIEIDSNTVERTMRPIALGRKNALFAGSDGGAETWAVLASLVNTAKLNAIDPYVYMLDILDRIVSGRTPINRIDELLAWNWKASRTSRAQMAA